MTQAITPPVAIDSDIFYPSEDGTPLAETSLHADAIITIVAILRNYLAESFSDRSPVVLADQFLYYAQGFPRLRVAPDIMVILDIPQVPYDNYKIWETGRVPIVVFEISSASTQSQDQEHKKDLYESLGVEEYWLFDPRGEWIKDKLQGYRLTLSDGGQVYKTIEDCCSHQLGLKLAVEGSLIAFYRQDTGEKLPPPQELSAALARQTRIAEQERFKAEQERLRAEEEKSRAEQERLRAEQEKSRAEKAEQEIKRLHDRLLSLGIDPQANF